MKSNFNATLLFMAFYIANAQISIAEDMVSQDTLLRVNAEQIRLSDQETLGWVGTSYLLEAAPHFFVGASLYGAATGERGGFFSIGPEFTWRNSFSDDWSSDIGLYLGGGGGGGANSLVGGGFVVRPHLDLSYSFGPYQAGLTASLVRFPTGTISSQQLGVVFSAQHDFAHLDQQPKDTSVKFLQGGLGFNRIRGTVAAYNGKLLNGSKVKQTVTMLGMRADHLLSPNVYWGVEVVGAADGVLGGYGEYLATLGAELPVVQDMLHVGGRVALGMAGGGGAATKGGMLAKAGINFILDWGKRYHTSLEGGYVIAPQGRMQAQYISADLTVDLNHPYAAFDAFEIGRYEWQMGLFNYSTVIPKGSVSSVPLGGVEIRVNRFLDNHFYHGLHIMYAAQGRNYGGYGHTFADVGYRTSPLLKSHVSLAAEIAVGGGGGANISVGGGALYMGNLYLDYQHSSKLGVRLGIGRLKALQGSLDTMVSEVLMTYTYDLEEMIR